MKRIIMACLLAIVFLFVGCNNRKLNTCPCAIRVDGQTYLTFDEVVEETDGIEVFGYITSAVGISEMPSEDNQANFGTCLNQPYGVRDGQMYIYYSDEWHICYLDND